MRADPGRLPRLLSCLLARVVGQSGGQLPHVEISVVDYHEEQAQEEGGKYGDEYTSAIPSVDGALVTEGPQCDEQDVLHQHDGVEGENLQLRVLLLQVEVAEDVNVGHKEAQNQFIGWSQSFALKNKTLYPYTVLSKSLDPFYMVSYCIKWVKTSCT